jgi:2-polyprenyl-3-methyl-5-hydroxy-6-metoxy-1,4-benzoquinol methylase
MAHIQTELRSWMKFLLWRTGTIRSDRHTSDDWDREYASGTWKRLEAIDELAHYSVIGGYAAAVSPRTLLDVCCGHGVLASRLKALPYQRYAGIDLSQRAINEAMERFGDERTFFRVADAREFQSAEAFDLIIFNECLYYLGTPREVIRRYSELLAPRGRIIVSMWTAPQNRAVWAEIEPIITVEDAVTVRNQRTGIEWTVKLSVPNTINVKGK